MKARILRSAGTTLLLATAEFCSAQVQVGAGLPNNINGITVNAMSINVPPSLGCVGPYAFQMRNLTDQWGQNGDTATYFTLPAGNGEQNFVLHLDLTLPDDLIALNPSFQLAVDGSLCTNCAADPEIQTAYPDPHHKTYDFRIYHHSGYAFDTHGVHEFGLRLLYADAPWAELRFKAVMVGQSYTEVLGYYNAPSLPLFILRDPPGDGSYSELTTDSVICYGQSRSVSNSTDANTWFKAKIGVAGEAGLIVTTQFDLFAEAGVSLGISQSQTSEFDYRTCVEATDEFTTSNSGSPDDVFIGSAVRYAYGMLTEIERPSCGQVIRDEPHFASSPVSVLSSYHYNESYIRATVIPQLQQQIGTLPVGTAAYKTAVNQRDVWLHALDLNNFIKATAPVESTRYFNGGGATLTHTLTTTTTSSMAINYKVALEEGLSAEFGLDVGGSGISGGGELKMRNEYGKSDNGSNTSTNTMSYHLEDDDVEDNFAVEVRKDPVFGTYTFLLDSANSRTSCRYEGGYQLDRPNLSAGTPGNTAMTLNEVPIGTAANFPLILCNNSDTTRTYYLKFSAVTNGSGAVLQALGSVINSTDDGIAIELYGGQCINTNLSLTQPNISVLDFSNISLYLYSLCDEEYEPRIRSYISISAHFGPGNFGSYCTPVSSTGTSFGDYVDGVQIGGINNTGTGGPEGATYTNYSGQFSTPLSRNAQSMITITSGETNDLSNDGFAAWIDYDHDGQFEADEMLGAFQNTAPHQPNNINFTVPGTAMLGATILRVRSAFLFTGVPNDLDPCFNYDYGETEDYAVVINNQTPQDCLGVNNGAALPGTPCDDGNADTGNDTWNANCACMGAPLDCAGVPNGQTVPGTPCDDGDPNTGEDMYDSNCACIGLSYDCAGMLGGAALPSTPCDDGDASTGNDTYDASCNCVGQAIDCEGVPGGSATTGMPCDDGDATTVDDVYDASCNCAGVLGTSVTEGERSSILFTVQPNPSTGLFQLNNPTQIPARVEVRDALGRLVISGTTNTSRASTIDLSAVSAGIYQLMVETEGRRHMIKVMVQR